MLFLESVYRLCNEYHFVMMRLYAGPDENDSV